MQELPTGARDISVIKSPTKQLVSRQGLLGKGKSSGKSPGKSGGKAGGKSGGKSGGGLAGLLGGGSSSAGSTSGGMFAGIQEMMAQMKDLGDAVERAKNGDYTKISNMVIDGLKTYIGDDTATLLKALANGQDVKPHLLKMGKDVGGKAGAKMGENIGQSIGEGVGGAIADWMAKAKEASKPKATEIPAASASPASAETAEPTPEEAMRILMKVLLEMPFNIDT